MRKRGLVLSFAALLLLHGCAKDIPLTPEKAWDGPVFISQGDLPEGIKYKVIGTVKAEYHLGYKYGGTGFTGNTQTTHVYPTLASEARKNGANAIIQTKVGARANTFTGTTATGRGTAVRVEDPKKLKGLLGTFH